MELTFLLNNQLIKTTRLAGERALDYIRREKLLTGTKEGCGEGECGACTVLLGSLKGDEIQYQAVTSCLLPLGEVHGKHLITIEGINQTKLNPIQQAFVEEGASQCGFCTPGFIVSLIGYFISSKDLTYQEAVNSIDGNICRCTGYASIRRAIQSVLDNYGNKLSNGNNRIKKLVETGFLPDYFVKSPEKIKSISLIKVDYQNLPKDGILIGGGTDLYIQRADDLFSHPLIHISNIPGIKDIKIENRKVTMGSGVTVEDLINSEELNHLIPGLISPLSLVSSKIIRTRATIGGNIVNASPIGDLSVILMGLNTKVNLIKGSQKRSLCLKDFYKGYKVLDLKEGELLESVQFDFPEHTQFHLEKISKRKHLDIASVNSAITLQESDGMIKDIHISAGGVAPIPKYLEKTRTFFIKKEITQEEIEKGIEIAVSEISPITDIRGTSEYKIELFKQILLLHFISLFPKKISWEVGL